MQDLFQSTFKVFYEDTDFSGRVYHARYLNFAERARSLWVEANNFNQLEWWEKHHKGFVVSQLNIKYLSGAKLGDNLIVTCQPSKLRKASLEMSQEIILANQKGEANGNLLAKIELTLAWLDFARLQAARFPKELEKLFTQIQTQT